MSIQPTCIAGRAARAMAARKSLYHEMTINLEREPLGPRTEGVGLAVLQDTHFLMKKSDLPPSGENACRHKTLN